MMNGCCVKDYKTKNGAMKRGRLLRAHTPKNVKIWIVSAFEYIDIEYEDTSNTKLRSRDRLRFC